MSAELDGSVRIAWTADGYEAIHVFARKRPVAELEAFAAAVADEALFNRTLPALRTALRARFRGDFDVRAGRDRGDSADRVVVVSFHPPRGNPNPDP